MISAVLGATTPAPADVLATLLAERLPDIPGGRWASITQARAFGGYRTVTASADIADRIDRAQYELGDGPCLQAVGGAVVCADTAALRRRWPELAVRVAAETPVCAVLSRPLYAEPGWGSLNVYTDRAEGFVPAALAASAEVAAACGLALAAVGERVRADNLSIALRTSRRIGMAIGIVMALSRCTHEQAFHLLRTASQNTHRKLRDIAEETILTGAVPSVGDADPG